MLPYNNTTRACEHYLAFNGGPSESMMLFPFKMPVVRTMILRPDMRWLVNRSAAISVYVQPPTKQTTVTAG